MPTRVPTVAAYVTNWLQDVVRPNLAPTTYAKYETFSRLYIVPGIGVKRLDQLQVRDVQTWLNRVRTTCQCCAQGKDARRPEYERRCCAVEPKRCCADLPAPATVRSARETLRSALSSAMTDELVSRNVAAMVRLPTGRARKPQVWRHKHGSAARPRPAWEPIAPGLTPHDLRHSHKTWMIEDSIPEVAQAERLGHRIPGVRGVYSHVSDEMRQRIVDVLQTR